MQYPYESLGYVARLEFRDAHGLDAVFHCYQRLRVLAPELFCVAHRIWGDGDQLAGLASPPIASMQQIGPSDRSTVVSTLRRPARAGDEIEIHSIRHIHHAFKDNREWWEYAPFTPTERARVSIRFPIARTPEAISVSASPGARSPAVQRPATKDVSFTLNSPTVGSLYRIEWSW